MRATITTLAIALGAFATPTLAQTPDWNLDSPATSPTARSGFKGASDGSRLYIFGGALGGSNPYDSDLWSYDGTTWTLEAAAGTGPSERASFAMTWDTSRQVLVFFGGKDKNVTPFEQGDTWEWDATNGWQEVALTGTTPPARRFCELAYYPGVGSVLYGGQVGSSLFDDTWAWDGTTWTQLANGPYGVYRGRMIYRPAPYNDLLHCGGRKTGAYLDETWRFDGAAWTQITTATSLPQLYNHGLYHDPLRDLTVVFGGTTPTGDEVGGTWEFDGADWTEVFPATVPTGRAGHALQWLGNLSKAVMFGGNNGNTSDPAFNVEGSTAQTWSRGSGAPGTQFCPGDGISPHTLCPCANNNNGSMGGCDWGDLSFPAGGVLTATGSDSMAANDTLLVATGVSNNFGVFFGADNQVNGGNGNTLNDGLRCAGGGLVRLIPPTLASGNTMTLPQPVQTLDIGAASGATRRYQYWFRTPVGPCGQMANLTNGFEIVWLP